MDLTPVAALIENLAKWRETEHAAAQDVEDADARVIAMDIRLTEAKRRHDQIKHKTDQIQTELADAIMALTAPPDLMMITDNAS